MNKEKRVALTSLEKSPVLLNIFIIRFWHEVGTERVSWRGRVQHVQSGEQAAFTDEAGLLDFIRRWVRMPEEDARPPRSGRS